jgi:hypothetical protein
MQKKDTTDFNRLLSNTQKQKRWQLAAFALRLPAGNCSRHAVEEHHYTAEQNNIVLYLRLQVYL